VQTTGDTTYRCRKSKQKTVSRSKQSETSSWFQNMTVKFVPQH